MAVCEICKQEHQATESLCPVCREAITRLVHICKDRPELRISGHSSVFFRMAAAAGERY